MTKKHQSGCELVKHSIEHLPNVKHKEMPFISTIIFAVAKKPAKFGLARDSNP